jgi:sugar phosphate isomerase/epimerase
MIKLGLVSAILPGLTFEELIIYAEQVGFSCIEACCWPKGKATRRYAGITHIDVDAASHKKLAYYKDFAQGHGITISSLGYYPNPLEADKEARENAAAHIRKMIEASAEMGIGLVTTFIGRDKNKTVEENLELYEDVWTPIVRFAEEHNVRIGIENCPMLFTANEWPGGNNLAVSPYIWREMFKRIPSASLGLNYDPSHPYLIRADYIRPLYEFPDKIFHVHLKDIKVYAEKLYEYGMLAYPSLWHSPKLPGLGDINFGAFVSALNDIRYSGPACIEVEDKAFENNIGDVKSGIEQSYRFMRQYL